MEEFRDSIHGGKTDAEFRYQICKVHRNLRISCLLSLLFAMLYVTFVTINHSLVIGRAINRHCFLFRTPLIIFCLHRLSMSLFFLFRLHLSFGKTQFGVRKIYLIIIAVVLTICTGLGLFYFLWTYLTAEDSCAIGLTSKSSTPVVAQDLLFSILISVLFISRFAVASQMTLTSGTDITDQKVMKKHWKYQYTMIKLCVLFLTETLSIITAFTVGSITDLAAATSTMMAVITNVLLLFNFQFNDHHFQRMCCGEKLLQRCCLGKKRSADMHIQRTLSERSGSNTEMTSPGTPKGSNPDSNPVQTKFETIDEEHESRDYTPTEEAGVSRKITVHITEMEVESGHANIETTSGMSEVQESKDVAHTTDDMGHRIVEAVSNSAEKPQTTSPKSGKSMDYDEILEDLDLDDVAPDDIKDGFEV